MIHEPYNKLEVTAATFESFRSFLRECLEEIYLKDPCGGEDPGRLLEEVKRRNAVDPAGCRIFLALGRDDDGAEVVAGLLVTDLCVAPTGERTLSLWIGWIHRTAPRTGPLRWGLPQLEAIAVDLDCTYLETSCGRNADAYERLVGPLGFQKIATTFRKKLRRPCGQDLDVQRDQHNSPE
jgi:hypothetical protein